MRRASAALDSISTQEQYAATARRSASRNRVGSSLNVAAKCSHVSRPMPSRSAGTVDQSIPRPPNVASTATFSGSTA